MRPRHEAADRGVSGSIGRMLCRRARDAAMAEADARALADLSGLLRELYAFHLRMAGHEAGRGVHERFARALEPLVREVEGR